MTDLIFPEIRTQWRDTEGWEIETFAEMMRTLLVFTGDMRDAGLQSSINHAEILFLLEKYILVK